MNQTQKESYRYYAFISYASEDIAVVRHVRRFLEHFRYPNELVAPELQPDDPKYLRKVFFAPDLSARKVAFEEVIKEKLAQSRYLIVVCSPSSAEKKEGAEKHYVNWEVEKFLQSHNGDKNAIFPILYHGNPDTTADTYPGLSHYLPPLLRDDVFTHATLPNFRPDCDELKKKRPDLRQNWENGVLQTISGLLNLEREQVRQRHYEEQKRLMRQRLTIAVVVVFLLTLLTSWAIWERNRAERNKHIALENERTAVATLSVSDFQEASRLIDDQQNIPDALVWLGGSLTDCYCAPAAQRLYELLAQRSWLVDRGKAKPEDFQKSMDWEEKRAKERCDSVKKFRVEKGEYDDVTRQITWKITLPEGGATFEMRALDKPEILPSPNGEYLYVIYQREPGDFYLQLRSISGNKVLKEINFYSEYPISQFLSPDGIHLIFECQSRNPDKENRVLVLDSYSLATVLEIPTSMYQSNLAFSHDSRLLAVLQNGQKLQVFDLWKRKPFTEIKILNGIRGHVLFSTDDKNVLVEYENEVRRFEIQATPLAPREFLIEKRNLCGCTSIPGTEQLLLWSYPHNMEIWGSSYNLTTGKSTPPQKVKVKIGESEFPCAFPGFFAKPVLYNHQTRLGLIAQVKDKSKWIVFEVSPDNLSRQETWKLAMVLDLPCMYEQVQVSPDGRYLVFAGSIGDETDPLKIYDLTAKKWVEDIQSPQTVMDVAFNSTGETLYVACIGGATVWRKSGETWLPDDFSKYPEVQNVLKKTWKYARISPQGVLGLSGRSHYALLDLLNGRILLDERTHGIYVNSTPCCFSEDGIQVAFAISPNEAIVYDVLSGKPITAALKHSYEIKDMQFLTVGEQRILCCNASSDVMISPKRGTQYRGTIVLWDINTKRRIIDHIPTDLSIIFTQPVSVNTLKLVYASSQKVSYTDVLNIKEPETGEEQEVLQQLLPLLCRKYGGGSLNSWRAPEFDAEGTKTFDTFCQTLTETQKRLPQVKKWLEIDRWVSQPMEQRTVAPGKEDLLYPWLERFAESEPQRCLEVNPCMPKALCTWISSQIRIIAEKDYVFGLDNEKEFSNVTKQRDVSFYEKKLRNPAIIYDNPRVRFFADYMSQMAYERCSKNPGILQLRVKILSALGKKEEVKSLNAKILESLELEE